MTKEIQSEEKNHHSKTLTPKQAIQHQKFYFFATEVSDEMVNEDGECLGCSIRFKDDSSK